MFDVICFSHRRQLQLHGYLESLFHYSYPHRVIVIYPRQDYSAVIASFPKVEFVIEEQPSFNDTLRCIVSGVEYPFMMFGCDDMVFTRKIPVSHALKTLDNHRIVGYSTRLHGKIEGAPPELIWDWTCEGLSGHWCYPFDLTGTIYRTEFVKNLVANIGSTKSPNSFESDGVSFVKRCLLGHYPLLSRGEFPSCVIQQVNNVQTTFQVSPGFVDKYSPEILELLYAEGKRLDWKYASDVAPGNVWTNEFFRVR